MKSKREYAFDVLRAIAMFLVIIIHVSNIYSRLYGYVSNNSYIFSLVYNTIARISVPIFFMISGALLVDRKFNKTKYFKRLLKYLVIIIVWDIIYLLWEYFYLNTTYSPLYKLIFEPYRAHLWFLYSIIVLYFLQPILKWIIDKTNKVFKIIIFIIWFIFCAISMYNLAIANLFTIVTYIGFFVLGKYLYEFIKTNDLKKYNLYFILVAILSFIFSIYLNYKASIKFDTFYNLFFAYRTPFIMISSFCIFILIFNLFSNHKENKLVLILSDVSLGVYLIHGIFLDITSTVFDYSKINAIIGIPLFSLFILICSSIVIYIIRKIKFINYIV